MSGFGDLNKVYTNIQSLNAQNSLNKLNRNVGDQQEKLSTGSTVNAAEDDAVAYSIGKELESKIAGLEQSLQYTDSPSEEDVIAKQIVAYSSAKSNTIDTDFAKEQSEYIRLQILQKTATSALSQANNGPQAVLGFFV